MCYVEVIQSIVRGMARLMQPLLRAGPFCTLSLYMLSKATGHRERTLPWRRRTRRRVGRT